MTRLQRQSNSESNKKKSEPSSASAKGQKSKSSSTWGKFKMSFSMRKKTEASKRTEKAEESEVSESLEIPGLGSSSTDPQPLLPEDELKTCKEEMEPESPTPEMLSTGNGSLKKESSPRRILAAAQAILLDGSSRKARGVRQKYSAAKPVSEGKILRLSAEHKPLKESYMVSDKLDHRAIEAQMKKKQRRDHYISIALTYFFSLIMIGLLCAGAIGMYLFYEATIELHKEKLLSLYGANDSRWRVEECGKLGKMMNMYRKRGKMYERSDCAISNLSTIDEAPWSPWSPCSQKKLQFRWKLLQPKTVYSIRG